MSFELCSFDRDTRFSSWQSRHYSTCLSRVSHQAISWAVVSGLKQGGYAKGILHGRAGVATDLDASRFLNLDDSDVLIPTPCPWGGLSI